MIIFRRPDVDAPTRIAVDPQVIHCVVESEIHYKDDPAPTKVLKLYFRNGGEACVRDEARDGIERISYAQKWGDYATDDETG